MPHAEESENNPYQSPKADIRNVARVIRSFQVGTDEIYTVCVETSFWRGLKTYALNDRGAIAGPVHRGPCRFEVGERERHEVVIDVDELARVNAYVDGKIVDSNLFFRLRKIVFASVALFAALVLASIVLVALIYSG